MNRQRSWSITGLHSYEKNGQVVSSASKDNLPRVSKTNCSTTCFESVSQFKSQIGGWSYAQGHQRDVFGLPTINVRHQLRRKRRICAHRSRLPHPIKVLGNHTLRRACPVWDMAAITRGCENISMITKTLQANR